jgi:hypothetical protein
MRSGCIYIDFVNYSLLFHINIYISMLIAFDIYVKEKKKMNKENVC